MGVGMGMFPDRTQKSLSAHASGFGQSQGPGGSLLLAKRAVTAAAIIINAQQDQIKALEQENQSLKGSTPSFAGKKINIIG